MRYVIAVAGIPLAVLAWGAATAFPDGAPWGAANSAAEQHCATCHFDADPVFDSPALRIDGLPARARPGAAYDLTVRFSDPAMVVAGFQMFAQMAENQAGVLRSSENNVEFIGSAIRSTEPVAGEHGVAWNIEWRTPAEIDGAIRIYVAASASNHDGSPFGDVIHFRTYRLPPPAETVPGGQADQRTRTNSAHPR